MILTLIIFSQEKHESGMFEQEISSLIMRLTGKKYFMYFENTKILILHVFKLVLSKLTLITLALITR